MTQYALKKHIYIPLHNGHESHRMSSALTGSETCSATDSRTDHLQFWDLQVGCHSCQKHVIRYCTTSGNIHFVTTFFHLSMNIYTSNSGRQHFFFTDMLSGPSSATGGMIATFSAIGDNVNVVIDICTTRHTQ